MPLSPSLRRVLAALAAVAAVAPNVRPGQAATLASPTPVADAGGPAAAAVGLIVSDGAHDQSLTLGLDPGATDDFDPAFDLLAPPSPPAGAFDARIRGTDGGTPTDYYADVRAFEAGAEDVFALAYDAGAGAGPVVLSWDPAALEGFGTFILASSPGPEPSFSLDMHTASSLDTSDHPDLAAGAFVVWSDAALVSIGDEEAGRAFALRGPFPNPSAQRVGFALDLPEVAEVTVEVFDARGRRVLRSGPRTLPPGPSRAVALDAHVLPAGAYLYRLTARTARWTGVAAGRLTRVE